MIVFLLSRIALYKYVMLCYVIVVTAPPIIFELHDVFFFSFEIMSYVPSLLC